MDPSNRAVLIDLANKCEPTSSAFALRSLLQEPIDDDHLAVLRAALDGLAKAKRAPEPGAVAELRQALRAVAEQVGPDRFVDVALGGHAPRAYLELVLPSLPPAGVATAGDEVLAPLAGVVERDDLGVDLALWCADVVDAGSSGTWLLKPLLRGLAKDGKRDDQHERLHERATALAGRSDLAARVRDGLLVDPESDVPTRVGAIRLLGSTQDAAHVDAVGACVEDVGAWTHISRATLTPERLEGLASTMARLGLERLLSDARSVGDDASTMAQRLAADPRFHTAVAKLMGSRAAMFGFGRLLVDSRFLGALKHLVSDVDAPVRVAAAAALGRFGSEAATPYLLTGVMDRHKEVRAEAQRSLRSLVGEEAYQRHIDGLQAEVGHIRERLQGATDWAKQAVANIEGTVSDALAGLKGGAAKGAGWIGSSAKRLLPRQKE
jgi:hypothetical protein